MSAAATGVELKLRFQTPYDWNAFLRFVKPRAIPGLESVGEDSYHRFGLTVRRPFQRDFLVAFNAAKSIEPQIRFFFDLDADPRPIAAQLAKSRVLKTIVAKHPGLRVPRCWDPFELTIRAMLGQQVTVKGASTLAGRLVDRFGPPAAAMLAESDLASIGLPKARAESIRGFARAVRDGQIRFDGTVSSQDFIAAMCQLPGIGPWTANYVAMRARGDPDAFPASDLGLLKAAGLSSPRKLEALAERWRPFRAYAGYEDRMQALLKRRLGSFQFQLNSDPFQLKQRLRDYFDSDLHALDGVSVSTGGTPFQEQVWEALRRIPAGTIETYGRLAARLGRPGAARAVGHANSLNPVAIIVPCHRVIGVSSDLTGYAGGLERKEWLLRHEQFQGTLLPVPYTG